jgi:CYTH domain-containing protein
MRTTYRRGHRHGPGRKGSLEYVAGSERSPGQGRYAQVERELRWLLTHVPAEAHDPVEIVDRYIEGSRLRLRRVDSGRRSILKLGQKVRRDDSPEIVMMTNVYLDESEFTVLSKLPARELRKRRWHLHASGRRFAVDEFHGPLTGLVLAETELGLADPVIGLPDFAAMDVTHDDRFSGGQLATARPDEVVELLRTAARA